MPSSKIKLLIVEDSPDDAELMALRIGDEGLLIDWCCVETETDYLAELSQGPDIILSDWSLPKFSGRRAFEILKKMDLSIPFIIVSGNIGEEAAIETMHMGVHDYVLKNRLDRLGIAVRRALENQRAYIERRKAEDALRQSEALLNYTQHISRMGGWEWYADTQDIFWTKEVYQIHEMDAAQFQSGSQERVTKSLDCYLPGDRSRFLSALRKCAETGEDFDLEFPIITVKGHEKWIRTAAEPVFQDGQIVKVIGYIMDITDRKLAELALVESEQRYRLLADNSIDVIVTTDLDLKFTYVNPSSVNLIGYTPRELIGTTLGDYCSPEEFSKIKDITQKALEALSNTDGFTFETEIKHKNDGIKQVEITGKLLLDDNQRPVAFQSVTRDITNRVLLEKKLRQAQKMESVGRLAGGIAHDFNNMLTIILGYAQILEEDFTDDMAHMDKLEQIISAARRSSDLTRQLLAFARKQTIAPVNFLLNDAISNMLKMLQRLIGEDIELIWKPAANPWTVRMDPSQFDQILANLTVNSRDAISGTGQLIIETENVSIDTSYANSNLEALPGEYVMFSVSDTGCGMDRDTIEKIFDPFFSTKEPGKGTGLGMSTVYGIVKQNKGFIHIYSELGRGTTMKIYLPRFASAKEADADQGKYELSGGSETILVVEDERPILDMAVRILEQFGYTVLWGETPEAAVSRSQGHQGPIDLMVTDVVMPQMDGKRLAEVILKNRPGMKTIFMSGYTSDVIAHHGILDENLNYLQKPFSVQALIAKVREVLDT